MLDRAGLEFSFSGLKTAVSLAVKERATAGALDDATRADIAAGVQEAIVDTLVGKTLRALEQTGYDALVVAGGVGANRSSARTPGRRRERAQGARVLLPAHRVLHRQCRHDRGGRHGAAQGGQARDPGDPRARDLVT